MSSLKIISSIKEQKTEKKTSSNCMTYEKKNQENENYFIGFIIYRPMPSSEKKRKTFPRHKSI